VGRHGIAWAELGSQRALPLYWRIKWIISRLRQTLTGSRPIHPKPILYHENIRVSFLWTTLWGFQNPLDRNGLTLEKRRRENCQTACKPGSVRPSTGRDDHSSGTHLTMRLTRPTRAAGRERPCYNNGISYRYVTTAPIRSCSRWGLPCRPCCQGRGALLPHRFALARGTGPLARISLARAVCFLWHCPWGRPRRPLAGTVFPWSPDFPPQTGLPHPQRPSGCLAVAMCAFTAQAVKHPAVWQSAGIGNAWLHGAAHVQRPGDAPASSQDRVTGRGAMGPNATRITKTTKIAVRIAHFDLLR
jgi:hypothetical protein